MSTIQDETRKMLREEMDKRGLRNNDQRAGLAAIIGGESHFLPKFETGYSRTSTERIRMIFPSRVAGLSDAEIDAVKRTDQTWFNFVYGGEFGRVNLGNTQPNDGYFYRGGGINQETGRANYTRHGAIVGVDLVNHPELINTPRVASAVAVVYFLDRYKGGDFHAMKKAFGNSVGEPDQEKNRLYAEYIDTGEWAYRKVALPDAGEGGDLGNRVVFDPVVTRFLASYKETAELLKARKLYSGRTDDEDPGPGFRAALHAYITEARR